MEVNKPPAMAGDSHQIWEAIMPKVIYLAASVGVKQTERYERYYHRLGHTYPGAEIVEKGWPLALASIDAFIFVRDPDHGIDEQTHAAIRQACKIATIAVYLARMAGASDELVLVPIDQLVIQIDDSGQIKVELAGAPPVKKKRKKKAASLA
jgi:hypothetical protein